MAGTLRKRTMQVNSRWWRWLCLLPAWGLLMVACQTPGLVLESRRLLEKDKPYEGTQQSMDYQLTYRYVYRDGGASAQSTIAFEGNLVPRRGLDTFILRLHLLNGAGDVVATSVLYAPGAGNSAARSSISRQIEVPSDSESIAFSHVAREKAIFF